MKMYILVKDSIPVGNAMVAAAHASIACFLKFERRPGMLAWISGPFYKTICKVTDSEFEAAKVTPDHVVITESSLDGQEVALAFLPREDWPKSFKFLKLYK